MKKIILLLFLIALANTQVRAESQKIIGLMCAYKEASKYIDVVNQSDNDKFKHCSLSCIATRECGSFAALQLGLLKEFWDILTPGDASIEDMRANKAGIRIGKLSNSIEECYFKCLNL